MLQGSYGQDLFFLCLEEAVDLIGSFLCYFLKLILQALAFILAVFAAFGGSIDTFLGPAADVADSDLAFFCKFPGEFDIVPAAFFSKLRKCDMYNVAVTAGVHSEVRVADSFFNSRALRYIEWCDCQGTVI